MSDKAPDKSPVKIDKGVIIPAIMLFIPGVRWVGLYLLWRKVVQWNVIPGLQKTTYKLGSLFVLIGLLMLILKFSKYIALTVLLGGATVAGVGYLVNRRDAKDEKCKNIIGDRAYIRFETLSGILGWKEKKLVRTLDSMVERGVFGKGAYVDRGKRILVLRPDEVVPEDFEPEEPLYQPEDAKNAADEYEAFLNEIDNYNRHIRDPEVSRKIDRIHQVANDIFACVRDSDQKKQQIRSFANYYLPTTTKILATYAELEKQSAAGQNIRGTKERIEGILDTLIAAYEQQLDLLFSAKAIDISSDIDVLETMMAKDGFSRKSTDHDKVVLKL